MLCIFALNKSYISSPVMPAATRFQSNKNQRCGTVKSIHPCTAEPFNYATYTAHLSVSPQVIYGVRRLREWGQQALALVGGHTLKLDSSSAVIIKPPAPAAFGRNSGCHSSDSSLYCAPQLKERWDGACNSRKLAKTNQDSPPLEQIWTLCQHPAVWMWRCCSVDHQREMSGWMRMNLARCSAW